MRPARWSLLLLMAAACGVGPVDDLPLVEMAPPRPGEPLAIFVSGDGGWRAIDRRIAEGLNARGYGVVGLVSPRFFVRGRTAEESAYALQRIVEHYTIAWRAPRVIVVGYSRGAGVLPFMINRLTPRWRSKIAAVALIGLEPTIGFQLFAMEPEIPVRDEVERLRGKRVLCFYGVNERDSLCRQLSPAVVTPIAEPGAHHFTGNYDDVARTIWRWSRS
jgi:type IV secretory pathway VirJ component